MPKTATFTAHTISLPNWGYVCNILVPEEIAEDFLAAGARRVVCMVNGKGHIHCAINKSAEHGHFIMLSKARRKALDLTDINKLEITLLADESEYGMPMPEEWEEVLAIDEDAYEIFRQLTPGRQRSILHLVGSAKREETRITRALRIAENLKMGVREASEFLRK